MLSLGVLGSGTGSNLQALLDASDQGHLQARVACVLSDKPDAFILERARKAGIPALHVDCAPFKSKLEGDAEQVVINLLKEHGVDLVVLAGFMRIVKPGLIQAYAGRIINIHPSLLPAFPGLKSWQQALDHGAKVAGCTVHFVDEGTDTGPIIVQRCVPVEEGDTAETLHARIQVQEHEAYVEAVNLIASKRTRIDGRRVVISPA